MITDPVFYVKWTAVLILILTAFVVFVDKKKWEKHGKLIFALFAIPVLLSTFYLAGHTVHKNIKSETGGPIHWHADYEVIVCGENLDLVNPTGINNKIGTPLFHEHNDNRIHVEGTVTRVEDVNVGAYFRTIGGEITKTSLKYDVEGKGLVEVKNGDMCNGQPSELKVYVNGRKIEDPANYMYYPHQYIPPGDCIIIEFGPNLPDTTEEICKFWKSNQWGYTNYTEFREIPRNHPTWHNDNWEYIDGKGMVRIN